ncbi:MAG: isochorismatase family protein [Alphaproteobacteria bacterium]|nr:isochorismatase family protein [Alphaproteobacteria bacterium]MCB9930670.1 isochorismatase family protein [Alphaproteobacteria bacterium]
MSSDVYARQNFGNRVGLGRKPALLIVDFQVGFADPDVFGGGNVRDAIAATIPLLREARALGLPVAYTRAVFADDGSDTGVFGLKVPGLKRLTDAAPISQIVPELAPAPGEYVVRKTGPSAFFGTSLAAWLNAKGVDSLLVTGATTSGCVRASVVDAISYNYRTAVVTDCCGDRALEPHEANLFDMGQKYADLLTAEEAIAALRAVVGRNRET